MDENGSWKPAPSWKGIPDAVSWKWDAGPSAVQRSLTLACVVLCVSGWRHRQLDCLASVGFKDLQRAAIKTGAQYALVFCVLPAELERM